MRQLLKLLPATVLASILAAHTRPAHAGDPASEAPKADVRDPVGPSKLVVVWPTLTPAGDDAGGALHRPTAQEEPLTTRAHELDATLRDATQDLGFVLDLADA